MSVDLYIAFVLTCVVLALTPGPNMSLFVANGASFGIRAALATVAGNILGLSILVSVTALGMSSLAAFMAQWFDWVRWAGALYLIWLGVGRLREAYQSVEADTPPPSRGRWFWQGLAVSLSNPKVLLFLGALFPQFLDPAAELPLQLALLSVSFVLTLGLVDAVLAIAVGSARGWFTQGSRRAANGISGALMLLGGVWLAASRRPV